MSILLATITETGRATCNRLDLNDERHNEGSIVKARRLWVKGDWHPPKEDPRLESELQSYLQF